METASVHTIRFVTHFMYKEQLSKHPTQDRVNKLTSRKLLENDGF